MRATRANLLAALAALLPILLICAVSAAHAGAGQGKAGGAPAQASVVGGQEALPGQFPWMAFVVGVEGNEAFACTGTVIAPKIVLTAAHCTLNEESGAMRNAAAYKVVTGVVNWTSPERQVSAITRLVPYPKFVDGTSREEFGDAALLVLETPTTVGSIPLAESPRFVRLGTHARIAGWGMTNIEQQGFTESLMWTKTVVDGERCEGLWGRVCVVDYPRFRSGACFGDSGGPLFAFDKKRGWIEFGLTEGGFDKCTTRRPQVYTRTDLLSKWIKSQIQSIEAQP